MPVPQIVHLFQDDDNHITMSEKDGIVYGKDGVWNYIDGSAADDMIIGGDSGNMIDGGAGSDIIMGGAGSSIIYGGAGKDTIIGGDAGNLLFGGSGKDLISGGASADGIWGGSGSDMIMAGGGDDEVWTGKPDGSWGEDKYGETKDLDTVFAGTGNDIVHGSYGRDFLWGEEDNDTLYGNDNNDALYGGAGDDKLYGGTGDDSLDGGDDQDVLDGGQGADHIVGGAGWDTLSYENSDAAVSVNLHTHNGFGGDAEGDWVDGIEHVIGSKFDDWLTGDNDVNYIEGGEGHDHIYGMDGADILAGGYGNDELHGGDGEDTLAGGENDDILVGGDKHDTLTGGTGSDTFRWFDTDGIADTITDFDNSKGADKIDLAKLFEAYKVPVHDLNSALLEGYIRLVDINTDGQHDTLVQFDADGFGGLGAPQDVAVINDIYFTQLKEWNFQL